MDEPAGVGGTWKVPMSVPVDEDELVFNGADLDAKLAVGGMRFEKSNPRPRRRRSR